ncbi:DVL domain-containing protein [Gossypium australe]|uniref:DVL domain-containing protein n=1 Tax=Gossypium australe TaxID=47621 RepID=A0A5B6X7S5_9ROSI|nr:DVL domain-containing protein [Gossypium australe]
MDEKWKLSKKEASGSHCSSSSKFSLPRSFSTKSISSKSPLLRSSSQKNSCSSSSSSSSSKCALPRSYSQKTSISRKCSSLAKEQKARFYIMRRYLNQSRSQKPGGLLKIDPFAVAFGCYHYNNRKSLAIGSALGMKNHLFALSEKKEAGNECSAKSVEAKTMD